MARVKSKRCRTPEAAAVRKAKKLERRAKMSPLVRSALINTTNGLVSTLNQTLQGPAPEQLSAQDKEHYENEIDELVSGINRALINHDEGTSKEYDVEKVMDFNLVERRFADGRVATYPSYLVKWSGYEEPTWQPVEDLTACEFVDPFWAQVKAKAIAISFYSGKPVVADDEDTQS